MMVLSQQRCVVVVVLSMLLALTTTVTITYGQTTSDDIVYTDCAIDDFYSSLVQKSGNDPTQWTRSEIINLLSSMHRTVVSSIGAGGGAGAGGADANTSSAVATTKADSSTVPYTIVDAIADLHPGSKDNTVRELFRDIDFTVTPTYTPESWKRGDVWPIKYGAVVGTAAATDVHAKWPIDWTVNNVLEDLLWGECSIVSTPESCVTPAVPEETAADTAADNKIKTPPVSQRGDVARAVLYNAIRYEYELGLTISDCPPFGGTNYGYLSMLLQWHINDPVDDIEMNRNTRACSKWQGNRNIFIDYPDLVQQHFGIPDTIQENTFLYSKCTEATESPTATPNDCSDINPGDVEIYLVNTNAVPPPNDVTQKSSQVVFFPLNQIPGTVEHLYLTDRAWNGTDFVTDEGTVKYDIPEDGIAPGSVFAYGVSLETDKGTWSDETTTSANGTSISVPFLLSSQTGDSILLYCINADNKPHFITGLIYNNNGTWSDDVDTDADADADPAASEKVYGYNESVLPQQLKDANEGYVALTLNNNANYLFTGPQSGKRSDLVVAFADPNNYNSSYTAYQIDTSDMTSSATLTIITSASSVMIMTLVSIVLATTL